MKLTCKWEPDCNPRMKDGDAGIDLRAKLREPQKLYPGSTYMIPTGVSVGFPEGYCGLVLPRSSTGREGLQIANTVPLIDPSFTGEIIIYVNVRNPMTIKPYERFAQLLIIPYLQVSELEYGEPQETERGANGFGSSGKV